MNPIRGHEAYNFKFLFCTQNVSAKFLSKNMCLGKQLN